MREIKKVSYSSLIQVAVWLALGMSAAATGQQEEKQAREFSGSYGDLKPAQIRLINDWFERYEKISGTSLDPEIAFNELPLSSRTTFEAVTHALLTSELNDPSGNSLGTALDLVKHVDAVRGQIDGAGGDQQFRIYCRLKPGSRGILERSLQFERRDDNNRYHKGYPLNYRQLGGYRRSRSPWPWTRPRPISTWTIAPPSFRLH